MVHWIKTLALWLPVFCLILLGAEAILRVKGVHPWRHASNQADAYMRGPVVHITDPDLGWKNMPGRHEHPGYAPQTSPLFVTFLDSGERITRHLSKAEEAYHILLMGGSLVSGRALTDEDTFAWQLQKMQPQADIRNFGCDGYGTYQSLLLLKYLVKQTPSPDLVIYGFFDGHENRNVAAYTHLCMLAEYARHQRTPVKIPYCTIAADGKLISHPPTDYPDFPFRNHSALINAVQASFLKWRWRARAAQKRAVTEALLLQMGKICQEQGAEFMVIFLLADPSAYDHYRAFLDGHAIVSVDGRLHLTDRLSVPGEGHPNALVNRYWAEKLAPIISDRITSWAVAKEPEKESHHTGTRRNATFPVIP